MKLFVATVILLLAGCDIPADPPRANWKNVDGDIHQTKAQIIYQCDKDSRSWRMFSECMEANGWHIEP